MLKMLLCLLCAFVIAVATLQMRQQQLELRHQSAALQEQIEAQQAKIWNQQLQIAVLTAPTTIVKTVGKDLDLVPEAPLPPAAGDWLSSAADNTAGE